MTDFKQVHWDSLPRTESVKLPPEDDFFYKSCRVCQDPLTVLFHQRTLPCCGFELEQRRQPTAVEKFVMLTLERVSYKPGWCFHFNRSVTRCEGHQTGPAIVVKMTVPDSDAFQYHKRQYYRSVWSEPCYFELHDDIAEEEILAVAFRGAAKLEDHEMKEWFRIDGTAPMHPHYKTKYWNMSDNSWDIRDAESSLKSLTEIFRAEKPKPIPKPVILTSVLIVFDDPTPKLPIAKSGEEIENAFQDFFRQGAPRIGLPRLPASGDGASDDRRGGASSGFYPLGKIPQSDLDRLGAIFADWPPRNDDGDLGRIEFRSFIESRYPDVRPRRVGARKSR
jgi:hypothetical protein